jgi:Pretoxin HINT domain
LIESLSTDIELQHHVFTRPSGEKVLRQIRSKEFRDLEQASVLDIVVNSHRNIDVSQSRLQRSVTMVARSERDGIAHDIALRDAERELDRDQIALRKTNLQSKAKQDRTLDVLRACSGDSLDDNPVAWWAWWDQKNDEIRVGAKSYETSYDEDRRNTLYSRDLRYTEGLPSVSTSEAPRATPGPTTPRGRMTRRRYPLECLVRGTMIQTELGLRAIETIRTGDLVLAQDIESGTLALKPVLNSTLRPPAKTLRFTTNAGTVQTTLGHYWWVDGSGWLRSKELEVGMPLHLAKGTAKIESIEEATEEVETFNLVVADYHTYFVGPERILSNDATELRPTMQAKPGSTELVKSFVSK